MRCPYCGGDVEDYSFCPHCGMELDKEFDPWDNQDYEPRISNAKKGLSDRSWCIAALIGGFALTFILQLWIGLFVAFFFGFMFIWPIRKRDGTVSKLTCLAIGLICGTIAGIVIRTTVGSALL